MNTQFVISSARLDARRLAGSPFRELTSIPGGYIYENQAVLPRFFLVSRLRPARSLEEAAALLKSPDFDPKHEAIVEGAPPALRLRRASRPEPSRCRSMVCSKYGSRWRANARRTW